MIYLVIGLLVFLGNHSTRLVIPAWRLRFIDTYGANTWKALYSLFSLAGLVLIVIGYGQARANPVFLWEPPVWTRHAALLLTWLAFVLLAAASIKGSHFKQKLGHPMYVGVKIWAFAHLIANGRLSDVLLFGALLVWAIAGFSISRRRDRRQGVSYPAGSLPRTLLTVAAGSVVWAVFAFWLHRLLVGVSPLPF